MTILTLPVAITHRTSPLLREAYLRSGFHHEVAVPFHALRHLGDRDAVLGVDRDDLTGQLEYVAERYGGGEADLVLAKVSMPSQSVSQAASSPACSWPMAMTVPNTTRPTRSVIRRLPSHEHPTKRSAALLVSAGTRTNFGLTYSVIRQAWRLGLTMDLADSPRASGWRRPRWSRSSRRTRRWPRRPRSAYRTPRRVRPSGRSGSLAPVPTPPRRPRSFAGWSPQSWESRSLRPWCTRSPTCRRPGRRRSCAGRSAPRLSAWIRETCRARRTRRRSTASGRSWAEASPRRGQ